MFKRTRTHDDELYPDSVSDIISGVLWTDIESSWLPPEEDVELLTCEGTSGTASEASSTVLSWGLSAEAYKAVSKLKYQTDIIIKEQAVKGSD